MKARKNGEKEEGKKDRKNERNKIMNKEDK